MTTDQDRFARLQASASAVFAGLRAHMTITPNDVLVNQAVDVALKIEAQLNARLQGERALESVGLAAKHDESALYVAGAKSGAKA